MLRKSAIALAISSSFFLSGCLEVEDNNDDIVAAIENNTDAQAELKSVTLTGSVKHLLTGESVNNAQVSIKIGNDWSEPVAVSNGLFELNELPKNSDFVLLVSSADGSFQERAFYGKTNYGIAQLGSLEVSSAETVQFEVLLNGENTPVAGLEFSYSISTAFNMYNEFSNRNEHFIRSTYNADTGMYSIAKVAGFTDLLSMDLDVDNDAVDDFSYNNQSDSISQINISELTNGNTLYVSKTAENAKFEVRVSVINELGNTFDNLNFVSLKNLTKGTPATFDADSKEYIFEYNGSSKMKLLLPSFVDSSGNRYDTGEVNLYATNGGVSVTNSSFNNLNRFYELDDGVLSLVIKPRVSSFSSRPRVVSAIADETSQNFYMFMEAPIELVDSAASLIKKRQITVVKGTDDENDFIAQGVTQISFNDVSVPFTSSLKYNDTFVTLSPAAPLVGGHYEYNIEKVSVKSTGEVVNISAASSFRIADQSPFDINQLRWDNNNGLTDGKTIVLKNTANEDVGFKRKSNNGSLYLPASIATLSHFKVNLLGYTANGKVNPALIESTIVSDGNINISEINTVSVAVNETILIDDYSVDFYTSLPDRQWYKLSNNTYQIENLDDNQLSSKNNVTFGYEYAVKGSSEIVTGKITLPVL
ncbi:hypothetical protein H5154_12075 [Pseudoalteromonas sp. SR44-5]|uniref:hypothetical protein n=1 Tax=Pseudoalteromonas TaxID=53246 RepID=UPI00123075CD|nr:MULTISPECIES: hypothetical protein [Pseudoalteromonas]MBB1334233.1 hypothetical protein [Pseudoalteromonas sp. SR41-6]MBB1341961.1 hypothetical protein [Pseudoalteromonas sp. SR45-6]MBB1367115.1 hypothetical protein [Pseudoalteromonas sp. SR44-5]MBB1421873.1 hypothetical protein [Pseudoalteromonas sp. SG43-7]MBB1458398.1 hypothetical protein [Pseudoalteromonas sp. SG41-8]